MGTMHYMAPELLDYGLACIEGAAVGELYYDETVDIFALGVLVGELVTGRLADPGASDDSEPDSDEIMRGLLDRYATAEHLREIHSMAAGSIWKHVSADCKAMLTRLLAFEPSRRSSPAQLLRAERWLRTASSTPLPHVVAGFATLKLSRLQQVCLNVASRYLADDTEAIDAQFEEMDTSKVRSTRRRRPPMRARHNTPRRES